MRFKRSAYVGWLLAMSCMIPFAAIHAQARDLKFQAFLIWATDAETSPNANHKPVTGEVRNKLKELPLRWKNYFEVKQTNDIAVAKGDKKEVILSSKCKISIKDIDGRNIEVALIGKGEPVLTRTQRLPRGEMLVLGGNAPNATGWLVVLKRLE